MYQTVLDFWFVECEPSDWFTKSDQFDKSLAERFTELHRQASLGELYHWRASPEGALAEIIVLDQFSRNLFRDSASAFATDSMALVLAQSMVEKGFDKALPAVQRSFVYMPYMHSESALIHEQALLLFTALGNENNLDYERRHKAIIDRFGRYPHRNEVLGRVSTAEEIEFLQQPNSSF